MSELEDVCGKEFDEKWLQVNPFDEKDDLTRKSAGGKLVFIYKDLHMKLI